MQPTNSICNELATHVHAKINTELLHLLVVLHIDRLDSLGDVFRNVAFAESNHALPTFIIVDGHDSGKNWTQDTHRATITNKFEELVHVVKELSDDKFCTSINLLLQVLQVVLVASVRVSFRIPSHSQTKVVAVLLTNVLDQILGISKTTLCLFPLLCATFEEIGRISSKTQNILNSTVFCTLNCSIQILHFHVGAGHVDLSFDTGHVLRVCGYFNGLL
mmetsp:Transcript_5079/g.19035  ORF Transcript_5079/g.19035 Transcript_5079/m.19035 type:complete len:219 (+) Transcript_5079:1546-2202(+)